MSNSGVRSIALILMIFEYGTFSVPLYIGVMLLIGISSSCFGFHFLATTMVVVAVALLIIFCINGATIDRDPEQALANSVALSVPIYLVMVAFGIFALVVSSNGGGKSLPGRSYEVYNLESYSKWMQHKVNDSQNWNNYYKPALVNHDVCSKFYKDYQLDTLDEFHHRQLSPIESGCCKPPDECNFRYISPTNWMKSENNSYSKNDCNAWENYQNTSCFDCQSCKGAFAQDLTAKWFEAGIIIVVLAAKHIIFGVFFCNPDVCCGSRRSYYSSLS